MRQRGTVTTLVRSEARGSTALITLDRPEHRNAMSHELIDSLLRAVGAADADPQVRTVVFTGVPPALSAGMDLAELRQLLDRREGGNDEVVWEAGLAGRSARLGYPEMRAGSQAGFVVLRLLRLGGSRRRRRRCASTSTATPGAWAPRPVPG